MGEVVEVFVVRGLRVGIWSRVGVGVIVFVFGWRWRVGKGVWIGFG